MKKVVINKCYGGFSMSRAAVMRYAETKGLTLYPEQHFKNIYTYWTVPKEERFEFTNEQFHEQPLEVRKEWNARVRDQTLDHRNIPRDDPALVQTVEELGDAANGAHAELAVIEIPDDVQWQIEEYDGLEHVAEKHRTWD